MDYPVISVHWSLVYNLRNLYLYGVRGNDKAKSVAIGLLALGKAQLRLISLVVHDAMGESGTR